MAPLTSVLFLTLTIAVIVAWRFGRWRSTLALRFVLCCVLAMSFVGLLSYLLRSTTMGGPDPELVFGPALVSSFGFVVGRMSPVTAGILVFLSSSSLLSVFAGASRSRRTLIGGDILSGAVWVTALTILVGYAYGAPLFYGGELTPVASTTAVCALAISSAQLFDRRHLLNRLVLSRTVHAQICRTILPLSVTTLLIGFGLELKTHHDPGVSSEAVLAVAFALGAALTVVATTMMISRSMQRRIDRTEQELMKFKLGIDRSEDIVFITSPDGAITYVNPAFERTYGYEAAEAIGKTPRILKSGVHSQKDYSDFWDTLLAKKAAAGEIVNKTKVGRPLVVHSSANPILDRDGEIEGFLAIQRDVTKQKQSEELLRLERANFSNSVENSPLGIQIVARDGELIYVNRALLDIWGYNTLEEFQTLATGERYAPEEIEWINEVKDRLARGESVGPYQKEAQIVRKDGQRRYVFMRRSEVMWDGRHCAQIAFEDITDRRLADERIRHAAQEWRTTFDSITDRISIHDTDNRVIRMNTAYADALGARPEEVIGKTCSELLRWAACLEPATCPHRLAVTSGKPGTAEIFDAVGGRWLQESTSPIFNSKREVVGTVNILKDVTERKQMEQQLLLADRLASIGELVSGIAHELNNPLTGVIGFSELLLEKDLDDDVKLDLKTVNSEAQRAARIVRNLLTFARKHAPAKEPTQMNSVVEDVLGLRSYEHKVNNITVLKNLDPNLPEVDVDYFQMQQVFLNIIINAEYFMMNSHGTGLLVVSTQENEGHVRVSFADDGPGIPRENLRRIFDPFFTTKEVGKGTGLGLSICHGIVTEHGGRIYALSPKEGGATFVVELPVRSLARTGVMERD